MGEDGSAAVPERGPAVVSTGMGAAEGAMARPPTGAAEGGATSTGTPTAIAGWTPDMALTGLRRGSPRGGVVIVAGVTPGVAVVPAAARSAAVSGMATMALKRSKKRSAICLLVASIRRAPSWAILPPTCAFTT